MKSRRLRKSRRLCLVFSVVDTIRHYGKRRLRFRQTRRLHDSANSGLPASLPQTQPVQVHTHRETERARCTPHQQANNGIKRCMNDKQQPGRWCVVNNVSTARFLWIAREHCHPIHLRHNFIRDDHCDAKLNVYDTKSYLYITRLYTTRNKLISWWEVIYMTSPIKRRR